MENTNTNASEYTSTSGNGNGSGNINYEQHYLCVAKSYLEMIVSKAPALKSAPMRDYLYHTLEQESIRVGQNTDYGKALSGLAEGILEGQTRGLNATISPHPISESKPYRAHYFAAVGEDGRLSGV